VGALHGSLSYLRFLVDGGLPANPGAALEGALAPRRFVPLSPTQETSESAGWVPTEAPFDDERPLTRDLFLFGDVVAVTYREDKWAVPRPLLKRETARRIQKIVDEEGKDPDTIGKAFVKAVEQAVLVELKQKTFPRTKLVDIVWDPRRREARVFGRGTIVTERVAGLFERTFGCRVDIGVYAARAFSLDLGTRAHGVLEQLSPGWLFPDALRADADAPDHEPLVDDAGAPAGKATTPKKGAAVTAGDAGPVGRKGAGKAARAATADDDAPPWDN
jgi:hypothetical protein